MVLLFFPGDPIVWVVLHLSKGGAFRSVHLPFELALVSQVPTVVYGAPECLGATVLVLILVRGIQVSRPLPTSNNVSVYAVYCP